MSNYTDAMVAELRAQDTWTYDQAKAYAEENGLKLRSVISKVISLGLSYQAKPKATKAGEPVVKKEVIVASIETALSADVGAFSGLEKATKRALFALAAAVARDVS